MHRGDKPLLVFVHLRKTAGTTVSYIMRRQFRRAEVIDIDAATPSEATAQWNAISPEERWRVKGIRGHFPFGPNLFAPRETTCFSILRDPLERVVSEYYFNLRTPGEGLHAVLSRERISLDQFVKSGMSAEVHNAQTRMLAGAPTGASPSELLETACANLRERLVMVGISERIDESLLLCRAILGWRRLVYRSINVNSWRPGVNTIAPETLAAIERANSLDRQLYVAGCARFEELLRKHRITNANAAALRRTSLAYGAMRRTVGLPREFWIEARMARERRRVAEDKTISRDL